MLYAKVIYTGVADYTSASDRMSVICGDQFDFDVVGPDASRKAIMTVWRNNTVHAVIDLYGDVWVMNESGKTISQFAVPLSLLSNQ
jgi:hypothetical protein